ncbi:MAG: protein phosphatase 2C domain-containing protein [Oscillospiraceae bacterium]|nr:protein phosphatase 2C domain-containing protein [Oscillospiraceae bacterium]
MDNDFSHKATDEFPNEKAEAQLSVLINDEDAREIAKRISETGNASEKTGQPDENTADISVQKDAQNGKNEPPEEVESPSDEPPLAEHLSDMQVMEHTANVWQYMDIIDNGTEMHSEFHEKRSEMPFGKIIGARVRGKAHKHNGTNCDDYFETAFAEDFAAVAVCDGAGSKPLSRIGSRVSAEAAVSFLKSELTKLFKDEPKLKDGLCGELSSSEFMGACGKIAALVQQSAREALKAQNEELSKLENNEIYLKALGRKPVMADLSTTFLAAVIVPIVIDGKNQRFMVCVQIGDGCICAINSAENSEHSLKLMGEADSGKFSSETDFLSAKNTAEAAIAAKTRVSRGASDIIMLMSDGVADDYFPAVPMMQRLYLDLGLNGILNMKGSAAQAEDPAPIRFKSVSMSKQSVALQYAKQLLSDSSPESMTALWDKRDSLKCHSLEAFRINIGDTPEERLRVWLDNYNERTSFDDRTLVIIDFSDFDKDV